MDEQTNGTHEGGGKRRRKKAGAIDDLLEDMVRAESGTRMRVAMDRIAGPPKPVVRLGCDVARVVDQVITALAEHGAAHGASVYQRSEELVRVVRRGALADSSAELTRTSETFGIHPYDSASLLDTLTRAVVFERYDSRDGEWKPCIPPMEVVGALLKRKDWPSIPPLTGVLESPALRPDGSIIQKPGYDRATGYLYLPSAEFPVIADNPSAGDIAAALAEVRSVVKDFPFAQPMHESAWLAFLLTLFARPAINGCVPLMAIDATTPGTGKGKLADVTSVIATGHSAPKTPQTENEEELRKALLSFLSRGSNLAVFDNISKTIKSPSLDAMLTSETWSDRVLGRSELLNFPNRIVWAATGNNLQFGADTSRRALHIRLESRHERPQEREDFEHSDILGHVHRCRARLVCAALTLLRGYFAAGAPLMGCKAWGSFEAWSRVVANCVVWVGMPDPQDTRNELAEGSDTTAAALSVLIEGWARLDSSSEGLTAKGAISALYPPSYGQGPRPPDGFDEMREAVEQLAPPQVPGKPPSPTLLGYVLRRFRRRVMQGRAIDRVVNRKGFAVWRVTKFANLTPPEVADLDDKKRRGSHVILGASPAVSSAPREPEKSPASVSFADDAEDDFLLHTRECHFVLPILGAGRERSSAIVGIVGSESQAVDIAQASLPTMSADDSDVGPASSAGEFADWWASQPPSEDDT